MANHVVEQTEQLVQPIMEELNLELVDVEYVKEGKSWFLRVFVYKEGGVDIEECGRVSELLSEKLDETDPIKDMYYLEVSSPGAERPLKKPADFTKFVGSHVHIKLYEPMGGMKAIEGQLLSFNDEEIATIEYKDKARTKTIEIPYKKMAKARLAVSFN